MRTRFVVVLFVIACVVMAVGTGRARPPEHKSVQILTVSGDAVSNAHIVVGHLSIPSQQASVSLTGDAMFTSKASYRCFTSMQVGGIATNYVAIDGSHFAFPALEGGRNAELDYMCIGN